MNKMDEQILVVKRDHLFDNEQLTFQGVETNEQTVSEINKRLEQFEVMRRGDAEENTDYKQPIPYVIIKRENEVYLYRRLSGGGEKRLHDKLSLGAGGHMNLTNHDNFWDTLKENSDRELEEELDIQYNSFELKTIGLVNDDSEPVSQVHIGLLSILELDKDATVEVRETEQLKGEWISINELTEHDIYSKLESWSQLAADVLVQ